MNLLSSMLHCYNAYYRYLPTHSIIFSATVYPQELMEFHIHT